MRDHARNDGFQSNKQLMLYLKETGYIKSSFVFDIMCSVDRKNFVTDHCKAYRDRPEIVAHEKTISAPHMHAEVMEQLSDNLRHGKCALDIGSGSGYLTICMALAMGEKGRVIGVDCIPGFQIMAKDIAENHYPELLENNRVEFIVWDGRQGWPWSGPYDIIHVGAAAANIPDTLIEQLAPGGCLIMPIGIQDNQVLVLLKKSLDGTIQKKELMKVRYGDLMDVDLPCLTMIENPSLLKKQNKSRNLLVQELKNNSAAKMDENIQEDKQVEAETLETVDKKSSNVNQSVNLINDSFWKSLENISESVISKPVSKLPCSTLRNSKGDMKERKTVLEKIEIFEKKDENFKNLKSLEDLGLMKYFVKEGESRNLDKPIASIVVHDESEVKQLDKKLQCSSPKAADSDRNIQAMSNQINISEENVENHEILKLQENTTSKMESDYDDSDETISVDTDEDTQTIYDDHENNYRSMTNIQLKPKKHDINKSFSKSLENFQTTYEPVSYLKSSISTILSREKNKMPNVREKIEIFEKYIGNGKFPKYQKNMDIKLSLITKESDSTIFRNLEEDKQIQKSIECGQNTTEKLYLVEKKRNQHSGINCGKIENKESSRDLFISELDTLKDEIKVMLSKFLSDEEQHSEETKLRDINIHINKVKHIQLMNNYDSQQNLERTATSYENLSSDVTNKKLDAEVRDSENNELQVGLRNVTKKVEKLQAQFDKYIEKSNAINEELQERCIYYENLDKILSKLNQRFKIFTRILANLIQKSKCHEKVLNICLAIAEKGETIRVFEQRKNEKTKEKINKLIGIISQMNEEFKIIGCNFIDDTTEGEDKDLDNQSEPLSDGKVLDPESLLSELNMIRSLLYIGMKDPIVENESFVNIESDSLDEEYEMSLLKLLMEE